MAKDDDDEHDIDEVFSPDMDPEAAIKEVLDDAGAPDEHRKVEPDIISDPGVEGGVDEPNESTEEPDTES
ncbi:MAG: hypothetical protein WA580_09130 [Acidimicrobiales bacterium]